MKKIIYIFFLIIAFGCGGTDDAFIDAVVPHTEPSFEPGSTDDSSSENTDNDTNGSDSDDDDSDNDNSDNDSSEDSNSDNDNSDDDSDESNSEDDDENNTPPLAASLIFPLNETECSNSDLTFEWNASTDADEDVITYTLILDTSPNFNEDPKSYETNSETSFTIDLPSSTALYWKIVSSDSNETAESETWSLYTQGEGVGNSVPQLEYIYPENGAIISDQSPSLQWVGSDNETSDSNLIYKMYFSPVGQDLELYAEGSNITSKVITGLDIGISYKWVVYVTDSNGATNVGDVYTFKVF